MWRLSCRRDITVSSLIHVGDAGNTSSVDAGTPLGATAVVTPRECWLSTLGVLHPGVPVMWYGHIRDLFPTAGGCMGSRLPNATMLHWAQQRYALVGSDGWVIGRLVGQGLHHQSYHTLMHTTQHQRTFLLLLCIFSVLFHVFISMWCSCRHGICVGDASACQVW